MFLFSVSEYCNIEELMFLEESLYFNSFYEFNIRSCGTEFL